LGYPDIVKEHARMKELGFEPTDVRHWNEKPVFFFMTDPDGYKVEVINSATPE
jgi:lactoylglutathione lyase